MTFSGTLMSRRSRPLGWQNGLSSCVAEVSPATEARFVPDLLGGVTVLDHPGSFARASSGDSLYSVAEDTAHAEETRTTLKLIP
jgi:hypothetical protein